MVPPGRAGRAAGVPRGTRGTRRRRSTDGRTRTLRPAPRTAASESPPPTTENASAAGDRLPRPPRCRPRTAGTSNTPIGPFHRTLLAPAMTAANASRVAGPMSSPSAPVGIASAATSVVAASVARSAAAATTSTGRSMSTPRSRGARAGRAHLLEPVGLHERVADLAAVGGDQGERHRAADQDRVDAVDAGGRSRRACPRPSRRRARRRTAGRARRRAASSTSTSRGDAAGRRRRVARSRACSSGRAWTLACARWTAPNASSTYASARSASRPANAGSSASSPGRTGGSPAGRPGRRGAPPGAGSSSARTGSPRASLRAAPRAGARRSDGVGAPLRPAQVGGDRRASAPARAAHGGWGPSRAIRDVVDDRAAVERDVEVRADEDAPAGDVAEVLEGAEHLARWRPAARRGRRAGSSSPTRCRTSRRSSPVAPITIVALGVEGARRRGADDVRGHDRVLRVDELAGERPFLRRGAERGVHLVLRRRASSGSRRGR